MQDSLESATRILLTADDASTGVAPRLRSIERIHLEWRGAEVALDRALQASILTEGEHSSGGASLRLCQPEGGPSETEACSFWTHASCRAAALLRH